MTNLSVIERDGLLVVDSRLVADSLNIAHKNLLATIDKYAERIESAFDLIAFETRKSERGKPERFAWLTEDQATFLMTLSRNTEQVVECKLKLVEAFSKAKQFIKTVIPAQEKEIERLKLELELTKTQERLMLTTQALATLHGSDMVALILGKPDAVITKTERVETLVAVDNRGRAIASFDGVSITYLTKRYSFKNTQACRRWLESIGIKDSQWLVEPALVKTRKLPRDLLPELDRQYAAKLGIRQRLLGE
jgi:anti-repressor protein